TRTTAGFSRRAFSFGARVFGRPAELIADAADRLDDRLAVLELLPQVTDVHVDGAVEGGGFAVIEVLHQGVAREHPPGGAHQQFQNVEFERSKVDPLTRDDDLTGARIERDAVHLDPAPGCRGARLVAPQDRADTRRQLAGVEWLGQVIVGAQLESDDTVDVLPARRQHNHRNFAALPKPAQNLETVQS